jgi:uncharacterized integral membrane protein (TIGR00698 family)
VIRAEKRDVASAIALTAVLGVCLVLLLPLLIPPFALDHYQYGVLAGMSVYAVPQVVAAAYPVSQLSGQVATLVKLTRVLLLGPVVVLCAVPFRAVGATGEAKRGIASYVPWFVALFLILAAARTAGFLPLTVADMLREIGRWLTIVAMAGLGFGVELATVRRVGVRVGVAVIASFLFMAGFSLLLIRLLSRRVSSSRAASAQRCPDRAPTPGRPCRLSGLVLPPQPGRPADRVGASSPS